MPPYITSGGPEPGLSEIPRQSIPKKQKDEDWGKRTIDAIIDISSFRTFGTKGTWREDVLKYYEYYNGIVDEDDYAYVLRPYGKERGNFPAKLHNFNIIKPTVDLLLGEFEKRPRNYTVTVANPDVVTQRSEERKQKINENLQLHFLRELQKMGALNGEAQLPEEIPLPEDIQKEFERNYRDSRAVIGQQSMSYMEFKNELDRKFGKGWFDWIVAGLVVTKKWAVNGEVRYKIGNPIHYDWDKSPDTDFIEDGSWVLEAYYANVSDVIDAYNDVLTDEEIAILEQGERTDSPLWFTEDPDDESKGYLTEVITVYWKSIKKIGIVTYLDPETGDEEEYIVEEEQEFEPSEGERVRWVNVNEVWEGTRIGNNYTSGAGRSGSEGNSSYIYKNIRPYPVQRGSLDNPSICKLPINGRKYSNRNAPNISLVSLGIAYQLTYNIYKYRLEKEIAKAKGMIALLDIDMIPEEFGSGADAIDKFLYYMDAMSIAFQSRNKEGDMPMTNTFQSVLDLTAKTIEQHIALCNFTHSEWEQLSGITRQRLGQSSPYDLKAVTEQSIIQSSHITEDYFSKYEEFIQREYEGLLDLSKIAFVGGKKAMYVMSDGRQGYLDLDGLSHMESEYGVFITGSAKENRKIEQLRSLGQQMVQAGVPMSMISEIIETDSFIQIKEKIKEVENLIAERDEAQKQFEQEMAQLEAENNEAERQFQAEQKERDRQTKIQVALIQADSKNEGEEDNGISEIQEHTDKISLESRKLDLQREVERRKLELQKDKQEKDFTLGKEKNKIDRKKVSTVSKTS